MAGSKRTIWLVLGLCLGIPLLGVVVYGTFVGFTVETLPSDRERVVTVEDLELFEYDVSSGNETVVRTRYIDWTSDVEYEYEDDEGLYVYCLSSHEHTVRDARGVYLGDMAGASLMARTFEDGVELVERRGLFSWGDQQQAQVLTVDGVDAGYVVTARKGKFVFSVILTGVVFDEGGLEAVLVPAFERAMAVD